MSTSNSKVPDQKDERSWRLRPFAPAGKYTTIKVTYTYPADYGAKMNRVGYIGNRSLAGTTLEQYGHVVDEHQPFYLLTDGDIQTLLRWMPGGWNLPKLRGILLADFRWTAADLPTLSWPDIIAALDRGKMMGHEPVEPSVKPGAAVGLADYIDLDQAAALVNRSKKTLARALKTNKMPQPDVEGGGGKKHEWAYAKLRPWLESTYGRMLPERPPRTIR